MASRSYAVVGLAVVLVAMTFVLFSEDGPIYEPDYTGIVTDVRESSSGFTFDLSTYDGDIRCFFEERPNELGYYGVSGTFSDDGSILFVSSMISLDREDRIG